MLRMVSFRNRPLLVLAAAGLSMLCIPAARAQQAQNPPAKPDSDKSGPDTPAKPPAPDFVTIHIEIVAGDKDKPVENASVYVRYNEPHKFKSDKLIEMNVKTSVDGKVKVPLVPKGRILIQVIAENWKTFGRWFDLTDDGQVFKIHLEKPVRWY
jgi:hypothetical protein